MDRRLAEDEADCTNSLNKEETNYILKCNQRAVIDIDDKLFGAGNEISNDNETDFVSFFFRNTDKSVKRIPAMGSFCERPR